MHIAWRSDQQSIVVWLYVLVRQGSGYACRGCVSSEQGDRSGKFPSPSVEEGFVDSRLGLYTCPYSQDSALFLLLTEPSCGSPCATLYDMLFVQNQGRNFTSGCNAAVSKARTIAITSAASLSRHSGPATMWDMNVITEVRHTPRKGNRFTALRSVLKPGLAIWFVNSLQRLKFSREYKRTFPWLQLQSLAILRFAYKKINNRQHRHDRARSSSRNFIGQETTLPIRGREGDALVCQGSRAV